MGLAIALEHGAPWSAYAPNAAALVLGVALLLLTRRMEDPVWRDHAAWIPGVVALALLATLFGPDVDGVHRWLGFAGLRLNASAAFTPWLLLGWTAPLRLRPRAAVAATVAQLVHLAQPDAGQATALAAGMLPLLLDRTNLERRVGLPLAVGFWALAAATWHRRDPLPAVDHVERSLVLASSGGVFWITAAALAAIALLLPLAAAVCRRADSLALAVVLYLSATFIVTCVGNFPVPVFGAGAGPVLGWYALLFASASRSIRSDVAV